MEYRLGGEKILLLSLCSILLVDSVQFTGSVTSLGSGFPFIELARGIICSAFDPQGAHSSIMS